MHQGPCGCKSREAWHELPRESDPEAEVSQVKRGPEWSRPRKQQVQSLQELGAFDDVTGTQANESRHTNLDTRGDRSSQLFWRRQGVKYVAQRQQWKISLFGLAWTGKSEKSVYTRYKYRKYPRFLKTKSAKTKNQNLEHNSYSFQ